MSFAFDFVGHVAGDPRRVLSAKRRDPFVVVEGVMANSSPFRKLGSLAMGWCLSSAVACGGTTTGGPDAPVLLARLPAGSEAEDFWPAEVRVDGGDLFVNSNVALYRVALANGVADVLHRNECGPTYGFDVDDHHAYVGTCGASGSSLSLISIDRVTREETVLDSHGALDVARFGDGLYFTDCGSGVLRYGLTDGAVTSTGGGCPTSIFETKNHLAVVDGGSTRFFDEALTPETSEIQGAVIASNDDSAFLRRGKRSPRESRGSI
jgi:hypothetical protein